MRMGQGVRTGLGHGGITCVLQTQYLVGNCLKTYQDFNTPTYCQGLYSFCYVRSFFRLSCRSSTFASEFCVKSLFSLGCGTSLGYT